MSDVPATAWWALSLALLAWNRRDMALAAMWAVAVALTGGFVLEAGAHSGRLTLRYDWILRQRLEWLVTELRRLGYHPYILLEEWEVPRFRAKFRDSTPLGALDWPPRAVHRRSGSSIYDPADQQAAREGRSIPTDVIR